MPVNIGYMEINFQSQYFINHKYAKVNNAQMNYVYAVESLSLTHATSDFGHNYSERVNIDQLGDKKLAHWLCVLCYYVQWEEALVPMLDRCGKWPKKGGLSWSL